MKVSSITNLLARSFLIFIIAWLWVSFYVRGFFAILFISTAVMLAVNYGLSWLFKRRNNTKIATKKEREHMQQIILQLRFQTRAQTLTLFKKALPQKVQEYVNQKRFTLESLFHITSPTESDLIKCINAAPKKSKIIIAANGFSPPVAAFARSLDVDLVLLDGASFYTQILVPTQTFPKITIQTKKKTTRKTLREIKTMVFNPARTKSYIITGIVILLSSLIIRLHFYYITFATIIFALALSSYYSPSSKKNIFDV